MYKSPDESEQIFQRVDMNRSYFAAFCWIHLTCALHFTYRWHASCLCDEWQAYWVCRRWAGEYISCMSTCVKIRNIPLSWQVSTHSTTFYCFPQGKIANTFHYNHICPLLTAVPVWYYNEHKQLLHKEHKINPTVKYYKDNGKTGKYKYALELQSYRDIYSCKIPTQITENMCTLHLTVALFIIFKNILSYV